MNGHTPDLTEGYDLERHDWQAARAYFASAVTDKRTPEALEGLGLAAWLLSDETTVFTAREGAYELFRQRGDALGAGRLAVWLAVDNFTFRGQIAIANGWLQRARTLLEPLEEAQEHGWLALTEAEKCLISDNDGDAARAHAARAVGIARRTSAASLEANALAVEGIAMVTTGVIHDGMSKLDEAATACVAVEVAMPWVISSVLCHVMDACDRVRDWDRAQQWFSRVGQLAARWNDREFYAQCRPHYAVVLTWRGAWADAESQLQRSIDDLIDVRKPMAVEGIVRLAELRWRQGRLDEAAALFDQVKHEPLAQVGQAELALDQSNTGQALEWLERCLRWLPRNDRLERMPALELFIRACIASGDCGRAKEALPELGEIAARVGTRPVLATLHLARGLIAAADGEPGRARGALEDAIDLFDASGAPFETARARLELARVLVQLERASDAAAQVNVDNAANVTVAAMAIGIASAALEAFRELAPRKKLPNGEILGESALGKIVLANTQSTLAQTRGLYLYETVETMSEEIADPTFSDEDWLPRTSLASVAAVDAAIEVVTQVYREAATSAIFRNRVLDRCLRDAFTLGAHKTVQHANLMIYGASRLAAAA